MADDEGLLPSNTVSIQVGEDAHLSDDAAAALNDLAHALAVQVEAEGSEVEGFSSDLFGMMMGDGPGMPIVTVAGEPSDTMMVGVGRIRMCAVDATIKLPMP